MRRSFALLLVIAVCACGRADRAGTAAPSAPHAAAHFDFIDVSRMTGIDAVTWCGRAEKPHLLESGGSGLALFDYDLDGDLDLYVVNGWKLLGEKIAVRGQNRLYENKGDWTFADVTDRAGVGDDGFGCGVAVGDIDRDGRPDLYVSNFGPDVIYRSVDGKSFERRAAPPGTDGWSTGAVFFDADMDGDEDLYVAAYVDCTLNDVLTAQPKLDWQSTRVMMGPFGLEGAADHFFVNDGKGGFTDRTADSGLTDIGRFFGFGVVVADLDGDLDPDLYVANDSNPNYLYRNDGRGHFEEVGLWSGAALDKNGAAQAGMGVAAADIDDDGLCDLLVTNFEKDTATLYRNLGGMLFTDESELRGLRRETYASLKWGVGFHDFDADGDLDVFIANGHIYPQADLPGTGTTFRQKNQLLENDGKGSFKDVSAAAGSGLGVRESSRGAAFGDIDDDGDTDIVISNVDAPPTILRNDSPRSGPVVRVRAPGAVKVTAEMGPKTRTFFLVRGGSYLSVSDPRFIIALGGAKKIDRLTATYADGKIATLTDILPDQRVTLTRPE